MQYQLTILVKNDLDEKTRKGLLDDVTKNFGKITKEDLWGVRNLAYPIKHMDKAYYAFYEFDSEPNTIPSLDKMVKLNEDIIRYLLVRTKISRKKPGRAAAKKAAEKASQEDKKVEEKVVEAEKE